MDQVTMRHPNLPGQTITVPASAVAHHGASGWEVVDDTPAPAPEPPKQAAPVEEKTAAQETPDPKPARRRRTQEGD
ncbi:hypothetical protein [Streptomyces sp. G1]|uniref:hypothetical protein n=1 Tax=Streptomyces sp. G1 TaxID=361572 RepID=UPI00202F3624|nr:hypothetical protein [Streptomyces sp. G1]MCM1972330.1 hypothetical protein [Streptomyces sp. G1]